MTERIQVIVDASAKGAVRGLTETATAAEGAGTKSMGARVALSLLDKTGLSASTTLGGKLAGSISESGTLMGGLEKSGLSAGTMLGVGIPAAAAVGGAALAKFALDGVGQFESATAEVRTLQRTIGGTAEDASRLRFAAKALGVDLGTLARGAGILEKNIGNDKSKLKEFGVQIDTDKQGNVDFAGTISNIAQAYQATDNPAKKAAIGNAAFGKSYQQLIPLLSKSKSELKNLYDEAGKQHQVFSSTDTEQGRKLGLATKELHTEIQGLEIEVGKGLVPALASGTRGLTDMMQAADKATGPVGGLGGALSKYMKATAESLPGIGMVAKAWDLYGQSQDHAKPKVEAETTAQRALTQQVQAATTATLAQTQALDSQVSSSLGYEASLRALAQSTRDYQQAQLIALAAKNKDPAANQAANDSLFALKQQINSTAEAAKKKAVDDAGPNVGAQEAATLGNEAYRRSLEAAAQSSIPAVRTQAFLLLGTLQGYEHHDFHATASLDTSQAHEAINSLKTHWDQVAAAMGPVGPQGP